VHFNERDVVRHNLVQQIIRAYEEFEAGQRRAFTARAGAGKGKTRQRQRQARPSAEARSDAPAERRSGHDRAAMLQSDATRDDPAARRRSSSPRNPMVVNRQRRISHRTRSAQAVRRARPPRIALRRRRRHRLPGQRRRDRAPESPLSRQARPHRRAFISFWPRAAQKISSCASRGVARRYAPAISRFLRRAARRNARRLDRTLPAELRVLILHGMLHLAGYDHETDRGEMESHRAAFAPPPGRGLSDMAILSAYFPGDVLVRRPGRFLLCRSHLPRIGPRDLAAAFTTA
jgi:hypothetical protein